MRFVLPNELATATNADWLCCLKNHNQDMVYEQAVSRCYIEITSTTGEGFKEIHLNFWNTRNVYTKWFPRGAVQWWPLSALCTVHAGWHHLVHCHVSDLYLRYVVNKIPGSQKLQLNQAILGNSQRRQNKLFFTTVQHWHCIGSLVLN